MATPRTDNTTDDKQRPRDDDDPGTTARQRIAKERDEEGFLDRMAEERKRHDFIERTRPDDPSDHFGQLTRDNVNPDIPSAEPGKGDIVDPRSIGMEMASGAGSTQDDTPEGKEAPPLPDAHPDMLAARKISPNEPWGSNVGGEPAPGEGGGEGTERPALVLKSIDPDTIPVQPEEIAEIPLTVTGDGFTNECVVLFDDEEVPTTFVSKTQLKAQVPIAPAEGTYDVEVALGEELSDVLVFEIVAAEEGPGTTRAKREPQKKPKKSEPVSKRAKKSKGRK